MMNFVSNSCPVGALSSLCKCARPSKYARLSQYARLSLLLFFGLMGCSDKPGNLLKEETYLDVMTELAFANELDEKTLEGIDRSDVTDSVYAKYRVTADQFLASHNYYQRDSKEHQERIERVEKRIQTERERLREHIRNLQEEAARQDTSSRNKNRLQRQAKLPVLPKDF